MASSTNNVSSNFSRPLMRVFLEHFEAARVLTRSVNTQLIKGQFSPRSGSQVDVKRPHDYKTDRTSDGDISSTDKSDILAGKATATVQNYFTVHMDWDEVDEALKLDQLDQILGPAATRIVTDMETDFADYMMQNCNLHVGTPGTIADAWSDVAYANALMDSIGVPNDGNRCYAMNPYTSAVLADAQNSLNNGDNSLVNDAWRNSMVSSKIAGLKAIKASTLGTYTSGDTTTDRAGTLSANPTVTYVAAKDSMTQSLAIENFTGAAEIKAGEIVQITGRNRIGLATREGFTNQSGSQVLWSGVVTADVTLTAGAGTIVVAGPAIFEANGQYNTVDSAPVSGDVITVLGSDSTVYQPNMFFHRDAFGIASVPLKKLYATDTIATTKDGLQIRVTRYADGDANKQKVRFDLLPAYATFNPFFAGQGFGH